MVHEVEFLANVVVGPLGLVTEREIELSIHLTAQCGVSLIRAIIRAHRKRSRPLPMDLRWSIGATSSVLFQEFVARFIMRTSETGH